MTKNKVLNNIYAGKMIQCTEIEYPEIREILISFVISYTCRDRYKYAIAQVAYMEVARLDNWFFGEDTLSR